MYGGLVMPGQSIFTPLFGVTGKQRDMALLPPCVRRPESAHTNKLIGATTCRGERLVYYDLVATERSILMGMVMLL